MGVRLEVEMFPDRRTVLVRVKGLLCAEGEAAIGSLVQHLEDGVGGVLVLELSEASLPSRGATTFAQLLVAATVHGSWQVVVCNAPRGLPMVQRHGAPGPTSVLDWHVKRGRGEDWADVVRRVREPLAGVLR